MLLSSYLAVTVLALNGASGIAQTWQDGPASYNLNNCIRVNTKTDTKSVKCTVDYTYTGNSDKTTASFYFGYFKLVGPDGKEYPPNQVVVSSGESSTTSFFGVSVYKNLPVKVTFFFDYPLQYVSITRLVFANKVFANVPIRGGVTAAPKPVTTTVTTTPSSATAGKFNVSLSNCTPAASGTYTCTGAVLTPMK
ncbi:hypothetical protein GCM10022631_38830 [Deinococcus rubellus]|uniref:Secreted protein n=1 Tax=Deinococcus rubellus TaxID=1889240 RepID=A0ABY5YD72_9DEIO|nr:hypothetical protein [Deinococcus rubellus]UWX63020.1 hypothetical protein N0D28_09620 [Deinococcus rubellus]